MLAAENPRNAIVDKILPNTAAEAARQQLQALSLARSNSNDAKGRGPAATGAKRALPFDFLPAKRPSFGELHPLVKHIDATYCYYPHKMLGEGSQAKIFLGRNKETKEQVAVKVINKSIFFATFADDCWSKKKLYKESRILSKISHKNVTKLYAVIEDDDELYLVMEYLGGGDLHKYLNHRSGRVSETLAKAFFVQLIEAVNAMHEKNVVHRDIKLENILIDKEKGKIAVADFGLSAHVVDNKLLEDYCGSPVYVSPEVARHIPYDGKKYDVWSCGVVLYTLIYGKYPFYSDTTKKLLHQIVTTETLIPPFSSTGVRVSEPCKHLISMLLKKNPDLRPTIQQIMEHPWLREEFAALRSGSRTSELPSDGR